MRWFDELHAADMYIRLHICFRSRAITIRNWERKRLADVSGSPLFGAASTMAIEARIAEDASYQNAFTDTSLHIFTKESIDDTLIDSIGSFT